MSFLSKAINKVKEVTQEFQDDVTSMFSNVSDGSAGLFKSLGLPPSASAEDVLAEITVDATRIPDLTKQQMIELQQEGKYEEAAEVIAPYTKDEYKGITLIQTLKFLPSTIAGTTVIDAGGAVIKDTYEVGRYTLPEDDEDTTYKEITTVEELEADIASVHRPVTELVVHWVESYTNANLTSEDINARQELLGHSEGIQYHYVIRRDGTLQRGANVEDVTDHSRHSTYTLAVAFVGGYNTATESKNFEFNTGIRSLNRVQFNTFDQLVRVFYNKYPGGQVLGHNDIEEEHEDPGFDVIEYCFSKFGKSTKFTNAFERLAFSPEEINDY